MLYSGQHLDIVMGHFDELRHNSDGISQKMSVTILSSNLKNALLWPNGFNKFINASRLILWCMNIINQHNNV